MLIWRGFGIIVPIVFVISGLLVSWISGDPDTRLGNPTFIGWTSMWSGIVLTLIGLALLGGGDDKDDQGNPIKKKHDFFWIPVVVWGIVLGGLSAYLLIFAGKSDAETTTSTTTSTNNDSIPAEVPTPTTRIVNFYNPTKDSLTYIVADETGDGLIDRKKVGPMSFLSLELAEGTYLFSAFNGKKETTVSLPAKEDAGDEKRYAMVKDADGKSLYQRILGAATKENDDYDEAWLVLDGKTGFLLVNVSTVCDAEVEEAAVRKADWTDAVQAEYAATDLIEPLYKQFLKDEMIHVVAPGEELPTKIADNDVYYLLVPYKGEKDRNTLIKNAIVDARF